MAGAVAAASMDVDDDMEIDLGLDVDVQEPPEMADVADMAVEAPAVNVGEPLDADVAPDKVHVRGLDNLATANVRQFALEHYAVKPQRVEWIDDTSANIVYSSADEASAALHALTDPAAATAQPLQLRRAGTLSTHAQTLLEVRLALATDVKKPRAADASRFYLLNPDKDPREQRARQGRGHQNGDRRKRRRDESADEEEVKYDESMYDDPDPASLAARIDRPLGDNARRPARDNSGRELFSKRARPNDDLFARRDVKPLPARRGGADESLFGRLRSRSASPLRARAGDVDGRLGFAEPLVVQGRTDNGLDADMADELPPMQIKGRARAFANTGRELFGGNAAAADRELFPDKSPPGGLRHHRRSGAFDLADETGRRPSHQGQGQDQRQGPGQASGDLFSRIDGAAAAGRSLADRIGGGRDGGAGGSKPAAGGGLSIKGAALKDDHARVRELFPGRGDSGGARLGRDGRRRAEDLFS